MEYEYCRLPADLVDKAAIESFKNELAQALWFNLGAHASQKVEMGQHEIFFFIGDYASAGLKFYRDYELDDGSIVFAHCRESDRVIVRPVGTVVIATKFKPMQKVSPFVEAGCQFAHAVSGNDIGFFRCSQIMTIGGLLEKITTDMRSRGLISLQCKVKLALAELPDDNGKKLSKNTQLRNCSAVRTDMIANDHMCPGMANVFLGLPKNNSKKKVEDKKDKTGQKGSKDKMVKKGGAAKK